jgi:putative hydrolase of the HAD superfamily
VATTRRPRVDAVLLDLDDTLIDTRAAFYAAVSTVATTWLPDVSPERHDEVARRWIADVGGHFRAYTRGEISIVQQRRRRADDLQITFGGEVLDDERFAAWFAAYDAAFRESWRLHDDVWPLFDALDAAGVAVGALSNSSRELSLAKLDRLGLADRLPLLASPDDLGFGKPDPQVFHLACSRLRAGAGSAPGRTAYVGDELDVDAQGATAAGLVGIWLDRAGSSSGSSSGSSVGSSGGSSGARPDGVLVATSLGDVPRLVDLGALTARR